MYRGEPEREGREREKKALVKDTIILSALS